LNGLLCRALPWLLALAASPAVAGALEVRFARPAPGEAALGLVEVEVVAEPAGAAAEVALWVDGQVAEVLTTPPFRFLVDLGEDNAAHRLEAVARGRQGGEARALLETPAIRIDLAVELELTELFVSVLRDGRTVDELERRDFTVLDDGRRQEIVTFARGDVPLTAVLLVDGSDSMRGEQLARAAAGARAFLDGLRPLDRAKLMVFSDHLLLSTPFASFRQVLTAGLSGLRPSGGTAIHDHLFQALQHLEGESGRRVVVLLSDGIDTTSVLTMAEVEQVARRSPALLYWIRLGAASRGVTSAWHDSDEHRRQRERLAATAEGSGGRVVPLASLEQAPAAFAEILAELRDQYVLGFYPSADRDDGRWHRVRVQVAAPGAELRTRAGYVDQ
jgi:Ca-activated chloride channel family protein